VNQKTRDGAEAAAAGMGLGAKPAGARADVEPHPLIPGAFRYAFGRVRQEPECTALVPLSPRLRHVYYNGLCGSTWCPEAGEHRHELCPECSRPLIPAPHYERLWWYGTAADAIGVEWWWAEHTDFFGGGTPRAWADPFCETCRSRVYTRQPLPRTLLFREVEHQRERAELNYQEWLALDRQRSARERDLRRLVGQLRAALEEHHDWHHRPGHLWVVQMETAEQGAGVQSPTLRLGDEWMVIDDALEYADSTLCERTSAALTASTAEGFLRDRRRILADARFRNAVVKHFVDECGSDECETAPRWFHEAFDAWVSVVMEEELDAILALDADLPAPGGPAGVLARSLQTARAYPCTATPDEVLVFINARVWSWVVEAAQQVAWRRGAGG
jgi:hypothetical protein